MRRAFQAVIEAAIRNSQRERGPGVLLGVRAICAYLRVGPHTFYAWVKEHGFPATRTPSGQRWITSTKLVDDWILNRWKAQPQEQVGQTAAPPVAGD
jgi:excisionase family DNA binding protein